MHPELAVAAPVSPLRAERCPGTVVARLSSRKAIRSGALWGLHLRDRHRLVGGQLHDDLQDAGAARCPGRRLRHQQGHERAVRAGPAAPDGGRLHGLQDLHDPDDPGRGVGPPDQHQAAAGRGGQRPLGAAAHRPDHPAGCHRAGSRRPRRRRRHAVVRHRGHHRALRAEAPRWTSGPGRRSTWPSPWWRRRSMFLGVGALTSQLAATRRQAASYAAVVLGVSYALRMVADAGVGLHWLIWTSPLGWVEELRPLTAPQPLVLLAILAFTAVLATVAVHLAGTRDVGASILPDRTHARAAPRPAVRAHGPRDPPAARHRHRLVGGDRRRGAALRAHRQVRRRRPSPGHRSSRCSPSSARPGPGPTRCWACASWCSRSWSASSPPARSPRHAGRSRRAGSTTCWSDPSPGHGGCRGGSPSRWRCCSSAASAAGVLAWLGAASQHSGVDFTTLLGAGVNLVPPAISILGIGVLAFGVWPRSTSFVVYGLLGWSLLVVDRRRHRRRRPLGPRHLGLPPHGLGSRRTTGLGGERDHGRDRRRGRARRRPGPQPKGPAGGMTTGRAIHGPRRSPLATGTLAFEDLTARARIREAALVHFAEDGYERATIRGIAQTAGVSPGLLRHHYGSKDALRAACDEYVFEALRQLNAQLLVDPGSTAQPGRPRSGSGTTSPAPWPTGPPRRDRSSTRWCP